MNISGIIVLDKPVGKSSAFITRIVGRRIGAKKIGHLGTLDPFATGVLPIAVNDATKLISLIKPKRKTYVFEIVFGEKTDTADLTGHVIGTSDNIPLEDKILEKLSSFIGEMEQVPSAYSAIKIDGKRAYELARNGLNPDMKPRKITVFHVKYIEQTDTNSHIIEACVSPGTYIRTLAEDIASSLKSVAYVRQLRRTQDGIFTEKSAITIDELEKNNYNIDQSLCRLEDILDDIPVVFTDSQSVIDDLRNGRATALQSQDDGFIAVSSTSGFFAIVECKASLAIPKRIVRQCY